MASLVRQPGLLGFGRDPASIVSQTSGDYCQFFSYCLPSSSSSEARAISPGVNFTSLVTNPNAPSFYLLEMIGISVDSRDIGIPPSTFSSPSTIIDSGTVITCLQPDTYSTLKVDTVSVPMIKLRFNGGVDVDMTTYGIFYALSQSQVCLAFARNKNPGSIGIIRNRMEPPSKDLQLVRMETSDSGLQKSMGFKVDGQETSEHGDAREVVAASSREE
ncbi:aspartyl protease family-like protein [Cinnamomum micranthum f. kanehirae]|uniref:Aspartyl protease family-like protein n=1 Tax=Cinnamomum micranthum f. kanehirae TaxID=337451 RepID=A0A443PWJ0_9MAGN|nr:aspartyl protease family-like protein [Cinnamomum micranthum f. kanehirae]